MFSISNVTFGIVATQTPFVPLPKLSVTTLIIAVLLFDRFGVNAKFKDRQVDKVLELAILLKETNITASSTKMTYYVHATQSSEEIRNSVPFYKEDAGKTILYPENFKDFIKDLYAIRDSYFSAGTIS
ncbi:MAG: hypothetical protein ACTHML_19940 [Ginsengibacter sp.]